MYQDQGKRVIFQWNQGLAGVVRERQKSMIIMDIKKSTEYDSLVDLDSILPVFIIPII